LTHYSHPLHPATVHWPIAAISLTGGLDLLHAAATSPMTSSYVAAAAKSVQFQIPLSLLPTLSHYTTIAALVTMVPSIVSGGSQLLPLIQRDGLSTSKAKTGVLHAAMNDVVFAALTYNWWTRRNIPGFTPTPLNLALSGLVALPMVLYSAKLGGDLVYTYGMGIGSSRAKKSQ
jgi:uncharacterized membrane protein